MPSLSRALGLALCVAGLLVSLPTAAQQLDSGETPHVSRMFAEARVAAYHGHYSAAIAKANVALALAPNFAGGYMERANFFIDAGRFTEATADLDHAAGMHPDAIEIYDQRAIIALCQRNADAVMRILAEIDKLPLRTYWRSGYGGSGTSGRIFGATTYTQSLMLMVRSLADQLRGDNKAALADFSAALSDHQVYPHYLLGRHCYLGAVAGLLDMAELTCTQAIDTQSNDNGTYDSRGFVYLKMHQWDKAIADYNRALDARPDLTLSLYGRGLARRAKGDRAGSDADIAAAVQGEPDIGNIMARLGVAKT